MAHHSQQLGVVAPVAESPSIVDPQAQAVGEPLQGQCPCSRRRRSDRWSRARCRWRPPRSAWCGAAGRATAWRCGRAAQNNLDHRLGYVSPIVHPAQLPLFVDYGDHITIGDRTFINCNLTALDVAPIVIGADCQLGPSVQLLTPIHPIEPQPRRDKLEGGRPITLGDNVWLGGGVIVCPGVTIGDNTVVGAGSVVTRDLPANVIAVGNPARVLRSI